MSTKKMNSMQAHFERKSAEKAARIKSDQQKHLSEMQRIRTGYVAPQPEPEDIQIPAHNAETIELRLFSDMQRLKQIQSRQAKQELKAELLPAYLPWIEGTLTQSPAPQNDVLVHLMVWAIDCAEFSLALTIAKHAILNDMVMPEPYTRTLPTVFAEQLAESVLELQSYPKGLSDTVEQALDLVKRLDMPDEVRAKLFKALGATLSEDRPKDAKGAYEIALRLDSKCGVKKIIEGLDRAIRAGSTGSAPDTQGGTQADESQDPSDPASTAQTVTPPADPDPQAQA